MLPDESLSELWRQDAVHCVLVARGARVEIELRTVDGTAFLRKSAPTRPVAVNEAEYLRLLLGLHNRAAPSSTLKPFALVIEEDRDHCEGLTDALRAAGMRVFGCCSGTEGVALSRQLTPDLIVLEYRLPDVTGAEVCRILKADPVTSPIPIVALTSAPEFLRREACGVDAVMTKPCEIGTLMAAARLFVRPAMSPES